MDSNHQSTELYRVYPHLTLGHHVHIAIIIGCNDHNFRAHIWAVALDCAVCAEWGLGQTLRSS